MAEVLVIKPKGLQTYGNHLSESVAGALLTAQNVVIDRESILQSRRGYKIYGSAIGSDSTSTAHQLLNYKGRILRHYGTSTGQYLEVDTNGTGTFAPFKITTLTGDTHSSTTIDDISSTAGLSVGMYVSGSGIPANTTISSITSNVAIVISASASTSVNDNTLTFTYDVAETESGLRLKGIEQNGNFYFTTSKGIKKISVSSVSDLSAASISKAGGVKALDVQASIHNSTGFLSASSVTAYRIVWGIKDQNSNLTLGTPSAREVVRNTNTSTSKTVDLRITIPKGITTSYFYQIYRTATFSDTSGDQDPGDEVAQVYENNPTSSQINTGYFTVNDATPDSFRGANLYTNADSGEGILQSNDVPPLAKDITSFKEYTFYANTSTRQALDISLLSVSALVSGTSTLLVKDGTTTNTYTFKSQTMTCDTHTSTTVDNITSTANLTPGFFITETVPGTNFATGTFIVRIIGANSIEISQAALASNSGVNLISGYENISSKYIAISQAPTASQQVDESARSLVRVINNSADSLVSAFYLSGPDDVPGQILLEAKDLNQVAFYLNVNAAGSTGVEFSPNLPISGTTVISDNEVCPNRLYYSKFQQPEAVPILNYIDIGPKDKEIIRVLGLRDNLFVLKEEGIYRLSGLTAPFTVYPFDFSTIIKAADSAVVLNNLIYVFTNQGITTVSDTGVAIISRSIEDLVIPLLTPSYTTFSTSTFALSYESDRSYYLFTVSAVADTYATQCFRYNTFTQTWTILDLEKRCGIVNNSDDLLYLGATDTNYIEQERKSFDRTDFADREQSLTTSVIVDETLTISDLTNVSVGDVVTQTQYLTLGKYNRLLSKLDRDTILTYGSYVTNYTAVAGDNLSNELDTLIAKIRDDAGRQAAAGKTADASYTALIGAGSSTFTLLQTNFNSLITLLNADAGVGLSNYSSSSGTTTFEFPIISLTSNLSTIETDYSYPIIVGAITVYNHIPVSLQFAPQSFGDASLLKQVTEGTFLFEDISFTEATISYSSDLVPELNDITITGNGPGIYGSGVYGQFIYGGNGSGIPFHTYIPRSCQYSRYLNVSFSHSFAREIFYLYGVSISFRPISTRAYR